MPILYGVRHWDPERTRRKRVVDFEEVMRHVEKIVVLDEGFEVVFKAGVSVKV